MFPLFKRIIILRKILYWLQIDHAIKRSKTKRGANLYAFEYLRLHLNSFVRIKDVQDYCNKRTKEVTGQSLGDPPRAFELLRKNVLPLEWSEYKLGRYKYVKYTPHVKQNICGQLHKNDNFSSSTINEKLKLSNYTCAITGLPQDNGGLAADHFIPKEKGGLSIDTNCVILNKILNEKKNKKMPIEWFCESLLTNFLNLCKRVGILQECKDKLIQFIRDF